MNINSKNAWVYSLKSESTTKYIHHFFCTCGHSFTQKTAINQSFAPDISCPQCQNSTFVDTDEFKQGQLLEDSIQIQYGIKLFENQTLWGADIYIDFPVYFQKNKVVLQSKKLLHIHMYKSIDRNHVRAYELVYYPYISSTYGFKIWTKQSKLDLVAINALSNFIMEHKNETIAWINNEDLSELSSSKKLLYLHYFIKKAHLKEFNCYYWDMVLLQNYTKEYNSELKMLDFIVNHRKEKSVKRAFYTSYKNAVKSKYYNPHSDFIFSRTIEDSNILEKLLSLELKVKQNLFTDNNYLEGMALVNFLKKHYTEKQISKLFVQELSLNRKTRQYWEDILRMIQKDNAFSELEQYFFKHKLTVKNLHDEIIRVLHIAEFSSLGVLEILCQSDKILNSKGKTDEKDIRFRRGT